MLNRSITVLPRDREPSLLKSRLSVASIGPSRRHLPAPGLCSLRRLDLASSVHTLKPHTVGCSNIQCSPVSSLSSSPCVLGSQKECQKCTAGENFTTTILCLIYCTVNGLLLLCTNFKWLLLQYYYTYFMFSLTTRGVQVWICKYRIIILLLFFLISLLSTNSVL